jgi:ABC-2 type transport system ATP-binding protein
VTADGEPAASRHNPLVVRQVVKRYGQRCALDHVDITVAAGEFVALLGPNGAGKTTLFQLLSGLFTPDSGEIIVMGHDMQRNAVPALGALGIVFQLQTLDVELSVAANLHFHAGLHGLPRDVAETRIDAALARMGLAERAGDRVRDLSGGNRRRVELARALLHRPQVLLMDEPTVGLDPASRRDLLRLVAEVRAEQRIAVLWSTHLCEEAARADRVVVLHRGHVLRDATPDALIAETGVARLEDALLRLTDDALAAA